MDDLEQRFELIKDAKRFCVEELGIAKNPSFEKFDPNLEKIYCFFSAPKNKNIKATRKHYKSFYDKKGLEKYSARYNPEKYDIFIREVEATSRTDGPINKNMLEIREARLLYVIFHENCHIHFRLNNTNNFNKTLEEPISNHFGFNAAKEFLLTKNKDITEISEYENSTYTRSELTNQVIDYINANNQEIITPETTIYRDIKKLEERLGIPLIKEDNSIHKAVLQDMYVYSKHTPAVETILKDIPAKEYMKRIVAYNKPIITLSDLQEAVK